MKKWRMAGVLAVCLLRLFGKAVPVAAEDMQTVYNSPYVSFSPDGLAWTVNLGDQNICWYPKGETVNTGIASALREPRAGEHYYYRQAEGQAAVGRWVVEHSRGQCIHDEYPPEYHGVSYRRKACETRHYSGWIAYCADCGEALSDILVYMSREAAETIDYVPMKTDHYSLCPFCDNLEQGSTFQHTCKAVSANMYRVIYDGNFPEDAENAGGYMAYSLHMYNDTAEYEGMPVTPVRELTKNAYGCTGYRFAGWNSVPDGSGKAYEDGAGIRNLSLENWNGLPGRKEAGTVILYAQWEPVESVLQIDPAGGTYAGQKEITGIPGRYGSTYTPDPALVEPPAGYVVTFHTNGGEKVLPVTAERQFQEWAMVPPFSGFFKNGVYTYLAEDGSSDTLRAVYGDGSIVLPPVEREGYSFGGWYYDSKLQLPAGGPGDFVTPSGNLTLYAGWVDLALEAADNYHAYGGSGAVDLSWRMEDGREKAYLLFQSTDGKEWTKISAADQACKEEGLHLEIKKTGSEERCTIPHSGIYHITLSGAQGGGYESHAGGKGGKVKLKLWLEKGEVLTFNVGGRDGYNGGGSGSTYGNGGGCTVLSSDKKGVIAVAGGGGGASKSGDGGAGGSEASLIETKYAGEDGMAGGGGGYQGGAAGEYILHTHGPACYEEISGTISPGLDFYGNYAVWADNVYARDTIASGAGIGTGGHSGGSPALVGLRAGSESAYLETPYAGTLTFTDAASGEEWNVWGKGADGARTTVRVFFVHDDGRVSSETIYPEQLGHTTTVGRETWYQEGGYKAERPVYTHIYSHKQFRGTIETRPDAHCEQPEGSFHGAGANYRLSGTFAFEVTEDVKGVYIEVSRTVFPWKEGCWLNVGLRNVSYQYSGRTIVCGYEEGQLESSLPAYGGSSYVKQDAVLDCTMISGDREGDGAAVLDAVQMGFQEEMKLENVRAADRAAPGFVSPDSVKRKPAGNGAVSVSWRKPEDKGTTYYHKAEAYRKGSTSLLCTSNITRNTLISGVTGYYYKIDDKADTKADGSGHYTAEANAEIPLAAGVCYLHLAAVDAAGNIGGTTHVRIDAGGVPWKIGTRQLQLAEGENVYAAEDKTYYVRCDGVTPFLLRHEAYMEGPETLEKRLVYSIFESPVYGQNLIYTPPGEGAALMYFTTGAPLLIRYPYSLTRRGDQGKILTAEQMFTLGMEAHGQSMEIRPRAGALFQENGLQKTYYSEEAADAGNGIILTGDGEGPVISGLEALADGQLIDRRGKKVRLYVTATDQLSGLAEFYIKVTNQDNFSVKTFYAQENAIELEITKGEPLFSGNFTVTAHAVDKVGNVTEVSRSVTELSLETKIERILSPHTPVFKCGESGILYITAYGYADRVEVEFPPELSAADETLKKMVFDYGNMQVYRQESAVQFMVPLYAEADRDYTVKVRAFWGDICLESSPLLRITSEGGSVLDEFRTRLR